MLTPGSRSGRVSCQEQETRALPGTRRRPPHPNRDLQEATNGPPGCLLDERHQAHQVAALASSDALTRQKAAALAIQGINNKDFGYDPTEAIADSADSIKAAELWWLRNPAFKR